MRISFRCCAGTSLSMRYVLPRASSLTSSNAPTNVIVASIFWIGICAPTTTNPMLTLRTTCKYENISIFWILRKNSGPYVRMALRQMNRCRLLSSYWEYFMAGRQMLSYCYCCKPVNKQNAMRECKSNEKRSHFAQHNGKIVKNDNNTSNNLIKANLKCETFFPLPYAAQRDCRRCDAILCGSFEYGAAAHA